MTILLKELNTNVNALRTSSTLKSTSSALRAISAVAELLVIAVGGNLALFVVCEDSEWIVGSW